MCSFYVGAGCPGPCVLRGILTILGVKKGALLGAIFGPSGTLMLPKPYVLASFFDDFGGLAFAPQKCTKKARRWSKIASNPPVWVPDSTDRTHPFAHVRLKNVPTPQTSKIPKRIVVGHKTS